jgi:hypothetical protein
LDSEDGVDFANELHSDVEGRFGHGAAKLESRLVIGLGKMIYRRAGYLEVVRDIVVLGPGACEDTIVAAWSGCLIARRGLSVGWLLKRVALRRRLILGRAGHVDERMERSSRGATRGIREK